MSRLKLLELALENIGPFRTRTVFDLDHQVVALVGPNGSGKTTVLESVIGALTGRYDRTIDQVVSAGSSGPSSISLSFEYDGIRHELLRIFRPASRHVLRRAGETVADRRVEIDDILASMGLGPSSLDILFARQWRVFEWLVMRPADCTKFFLSIFNLDEIERCGAALARIESGIPRIQVDPSGLERIDLELASLRERQRALQAELPGDPDSLRGELESLRAEYQECIGRYMALSEAVASRRTFNEICDKIRQKGFDPDEIVSEDGRARLMHCLSEVRKDLDTLERREFLNRIFEERQRELAAVQSSMDEVIGSILPEDECERIRAEITDLEAQLDQVDRSLHLAELQERAVREGACPVCLRPLSPDFAGGFADPSTVRFRREEIVSKLDSLRSRLRWNDELRARLEAYRREHERALRSVEQVTQQLRALSQVQDTRDVLEFELHELNELIGIVTTAVGLRSTLTEVEDVADLDRLSARMDELRRRIDELDGRLRRALEVKSELDSISDKIAFLERERADLLRRAELADRHNGAKLELRSIAQTLRYNGLGRLALGRYARAVEKAVNMLLENYGSELSIAIEGAFDGNIYGVLPSGERIPARYLSGGQKVLVSVALRFAVMLMLDLPRIAIFDEPGAGLDAESVRILRGMFGEFSSRGVQVLLSSHQEQLVPTFAHVIELGCSPQAVMEASGYAKTVAVSDASAAG